MTLALLGLTLVPDVLQKTPPFVDNVRSGSPAAAAGLKPDDLVLYVNDDIVHSVKMLLEELEYIDRRDEVKVTVLRGEELAEVVLGLPQ